MGAIERCVFPNKFFIIIIFEAGVEKQCHLLGLRDFFSSVLSPN